MPPTIDPTRLVPGASITYRSSPGGDDERSIVVRPPFSVGPFLYVAVGDGSHWVPVSSIHAVK